MRFMVIVKSTEQAEAGIPPDSADIAAMGRFNEKLIDAGIMLAGEGLMASMKGARIKIEPQGKQTIIDGPIAEAKELVEGFWILQLTSIEQQVEMAKMAARNVGN